MDQDIRYTRTVFFIVNAALNIDKVVEIINELLAINFKKEVAVVLSINIDVELIDRLPADRRPDNPALRLSGFTTLFYSISSAHRRGGRNLLHFIAEQDDFDFTEAEDVSEFFKLQVLSGYQAKHYVLLILDHGRAFGILRNDGSEPASSAAIAGSASIAGNAPLASVAAFTPNRTSRCRFSTDPQFSDSFISSVRHVKVLRMEELGQAIFWALGRKKIDVIVMINCYMQFLGTAFALRRRCEYLIAAESFMFPEDYSYPKLFQKLVDQPDITPLEYAGFIMDSLEDSLTPFSKEEVVISMIKPAALTRQIGLFKELSIALKEENRLNKNAIVEARNKCQSFNGGLWLLDFYEFTFFLKQTSNNRRLKETIDEIHSKKKRFVIRASVGTVRRSQEFHDLGVSIYLPLPPRAIDDRDVDLMLFHHTVFSRYSQWVRFIREFVKA